MLQARMCSAPVDLQGHEMIIQRELFSVRDTMSSVLFPCVQSCLVCTACIRISTVSATEEKGRVPCPSCNMRVAYDAVKHACRETKISGLFCDENDSTLGKRAAESQLEEGTHEPDDADFPPDDYDEDALLSLIANPESEVPVPTPLAIGDGFLRFKKLNREQLDDQFPIYTRMTHLNELHGKKNLQDRAEVEKFCVIVLISWHAASINIHILFPKDLWAELDKCNIAGCSFMMSKTTDLSLERIKFYFGKEADGKKFAGIINTKRAGSSTPSGPGPQHQKQQQGPEALPDEPSDGQAHPWL